MTKNKKEKYTSKVSVFEFIKGVLTWTLFSFLLIIALLLVYYVFANYRYSKKGEGFEPAFSLFTIISPSMEPNVNVYDVIVDLPVKDASTIKVGDIITFISNSSVSEGMTVTHRVTQINVVNGEYEFNTKGDNNETEDTGRVHEKDIIGRVKLRIPQLGRLQYFLASRGGWLLVILIPAVVILIMDIIKLVRMFKVKKKVDAINGEDKDVSIETKEKLLTKKQELMSKYQKDELPKDLDDIEMELPKLK